MLDTTLYRISLYTRYVVVSRNSTSILITWEDLHNYIKTMSEKEEELLFQYTNNGLHVVNDVFDYFDSDSNFQLRTLCRMFDVLSVADEAKKVMRLKKCKEKRKD